MGLTVYSFNTRPRRSGWTLDGQLRVSDTGSLAGRPRPADGLEPGEPRPAHRQPQVGGLLLYDRGVPPAGTVGRHRRGGAAQQIIREQIRNPRPKNVLAFAVLASLIGVPRGFAETFVRQKFQKRADLLPLNLTAVERATSLPRSAFRRPGSWRRSRRGCRAAGDPHWQPGGCPGLMAAGLQFFAGYPITPASGSWSSSHSTSPRAAGGRPIEDEISSLAAVIGASFAGRKAARPPPGPAWR